jgi:ATP-dependent Clp protease ATP-binding subunit ClpC
LGLIREGEIQRIRYLKSFNVDLYELRKEIELAVKDKTVKILPTLTACRLRNKRRR